MAFNKTAEGSSMKRRPMRRRKKVCVFCGKDNVIDYKDINKLKRYISERGKILPRRITGNCAKHLPVPARRYRPAVPSRAAAAKAAAPRCSWARSGLPRGTGCGCARPVPG